MLTPRMFVCGEGGIRTPGTVNPYVSLANWWFQPLTHLTGTNHHHRSPGNYEWDYKVTTNFKLTKFI